MKNLLIVFFLLFSFSAFGQLQKSSGVLYFNNKANLDSWGAPATYGGELAVTLDTHLAYRWNGSIWVEIPTGLESVFDAWDKDDSDDFDGVFNSLTSIPSGLSDGDDDTQLTEEQVEDFVGGMVTGNTESDITVTYQDVDGTLDFAIDKTGNWTGTLDGSNGSDFLSRSNHTGTQTASTISDFDTEVSNNSSVTANTAKVSNATHTGEVTGSTSLTVSNTLITGKSTITPVSGDLFLFADISNSNVLRRATLSSMQDGTGTDDQTIDVLSFSGTTLSVSLEDDGEATQTTSLAHASTHITGGADQVDGDKLDIDWNPTNYTPSTTPTEASSVDNLTSHLYGIDQELASTGVSYTHDNETVSSGDVDVDFDNADGGVHTVNCTTAGSSFTVDFSNGKKGATYYVIFKNTAGTPSVTYASNIRDYYSYGSSPSSSAIRADLTMQVIYDGTNYVVWTQ